MSPFTREQVLQMLQTNTSLAGIDLSGVNLESIKLSGVNLNHANLWGANLTGAHLEGVDLSRANLHFANLSGADLSDAKLSEADLSGADLHDANLSRVDLSKANLSRASPGWQIMGDQSPRAAAAQDVEDAVDDFAPLIADMGAIFSQSRDQGLQDLPLRICQVRWVAFPI